MSTMQGPTGQGHSPPPSGLPPAMPQGPTGVARALAFARGLSGKAFILALVVLGLQALMGEGRRPSDLIGGFHGATESAELKAKQAASVEYERQMATARSVPPANAQIETVVSQTQQQAIAGSLETQGTVANLADAACLASGLITSLFGDTNDTRNVRDGLKSACGASDAIRANMTQTLARTAREGSGVVNRLPPPPATQNANGYSAAPNGNGARLVPAAVPPR